MVILRKMLKTTTICYCGGMVSLLGTKIPYMPYKEYIVSGKVQSNKLRKKLLREGLKEYRCEHCGNDKWCGLPIPLEVHHKDGDKTNNELSNLEILCPNCHALTSTYKGKILRKINICRCGGIGRHMRLKISGWKHRAGSIPASGTSHSTLCACRVSTLRTSLGKSELDG